VEFSGAVLAGGQSRRFGQDKALYPYRGKPLLAWVLEGLAEASERFVVANRPYPIDALVYPDLWPGGGTMSGLHTALAQACHPWVAVAACDQPFLSRAYWRYLREHIQPGCLVVMAESKAGPEPLGALYHKSLEPLVLERLQGAHLKIQALLETLPSVRLPVAELTPRFGEHLLANLNTLSELEALESGLDPLG